ncbi:MAG: capsular biosynthesis protein, partial [Thermodesulfobacteriota bacterium]|nr:capsular biosynthesis protein [Thermodesulfobacteriota bacterium]
MQIKKEAKKDRDRDQWEIFLDHYPAHSRFAESYRTLRTNIHFSFSEKEFRSILITSAGEKEGKTTTVANLAYTMAQTGKTV